MQAISVLLLCLAILVLVVLCMGLSFICGLGVRRALQLVADMRQEWDDRKEIEDEPGTAVVDSSPEHLRAKREERRRHGEPEEDDDSQIVTTRSMAARTEAQDEARERRLDKWMPGVRKRG